MTNNQPQNTNPDSTKRHEGKDPNVVVTPKATEREENTAQKNNNKPREDTATKA